MKGSLPSFRIVGTGSAIPERVVTNAELEKRASTSSAWIIENLGIRERRVAREDEWTSDLAAHAGLRALETAGLDKEEVDLILLATSTPDRKAPSTACLTKAKMGIEELGAHPGWEPFLEAWGNQYPNRLVKDAPFLRWRYGAPGASYRITVVLREGTLVAAAFSRIAPLAGIPCLAMLDFMTVDCDPTATDLLHAALAQRDMEADAEGVAMMASRPWARRHRLGRNGHLRTPHFFRVIFHPLEGRVPPADFAVSRTGHSCGWTPTSFDGGNLPGVAECANPSSRRTALCFQLGAFNLTIPIPSNSLVMHAQQSAFSEQYVIPCTNTNFSESPIRNWRLSAVSSGLPFANPSCSPWSL